MSCVLLVEDDRSLNEGVAFALKKAGYEVVPCHDGETALSTLNKDIDLVILDVSLPGIDGFAVAKRISTFYHLPIIFLTAKDEETDMLKGYSIGCEDYITKPFSLPVLLEKIKVILKRAGQINQKDIYEFDQMIFDFEQQLFEKEKELLVFTATETKLLHMLLMHKNQILTKEQLLENVWGIDGEFVDENTLSVNIRRLRKKIENEPANPRWIKTVFGIGYKWSVL